MFKAGATFLPTSGAVQVSILGLAAVVLMAVGVRVFLGSRQTPAQREKRRRLLIHRTGRMGDATIIDVRDCVLYYSYRVRGVAYTTSQDASDFRHMLPSQTSVLVGPAGMKYSAGNPANSIVICEEWNGLRPVTVQFEQPQIKENSHS